MKRFFLILVLAGIFALAACQKQASPPNDLLYGEELFYEIYENGFLTVKNIDGDTLFDGGSLPSGFDLQSLQWNKYDQSWLLSLTNTSGSDIYKYKDGILTRQSMSPEILKGELALSPDGTMVAYIGSTNSSQDVYLLDLVEGTDLNLMPQPANESNIQWSADSQSVFFRTDFNGLPNIYRIDISTKHLTNISKGSGVDGNFAISPDGKWLAVETDRFGGNDLAIIEIHSGDVRKITDFASSAVVAEPTWSHDSKYLIYRTSIREETVLELYNTQTYSSITLTPKEMVAILPVWSEDTSTIAFTGIRDGQTDIYTVNTNGLINNITNTHHINETSPSYLYIEKQSN
jgi:Tol biopolymer transport system component